MPNPVTIAKAAGTAAKVAKNVSKANKAAKAAGNAMNLTQLLGSAGKGGSVINVTQMAKALSKNPELAAFMKEAIKTKSGRKKAAEFAKNMYTYGPALTGMAGSALSGQSGMGSTIGSLAGDLGGSALGGTIGAAIGSAVLPGIGTAAGGAIGSILGGMAGGAAGDKIGGAVEDKVKESKQPDAVTSPAPIGSDSKPKGDNSFRKYGPSPLEQFGLDVALPVLGDAASVAGQTYGAYNSLLANAILAMHAQDSQRWDGAMGYGAAPLAALPYATKGALGNVLGNAVSNRMYTVADTLKRNNQNVRNMEYQADYHAPGLFWNSTYVNSPLRYGAAGNSPSKGVN